MSDKPMHIRKPFGGIVKVFMNADPPYATFVNVTGYTLTVHLHRGDDGRYVVDEGNGYSLLRTHFPRGTFKGVDLNILISRRGAERIQAADDKRKKADGNDG